MSTRIRIAGAGESWGPPTPRRCPALSSVRPRAVTERRGNVLFIPSGRQGFGKRRGREDTLQSRAKLLHSPRTLSRTKATSPITSGRREETAALPVPLLQASWQSPPPARGKLEGQASVALVFGVAVRCGKEYALRFGNTTAPLLRNRAYICIYLFIFWGRNRVIENPRSLVALVFE